MPLTRSFARRKRMEELHDQKIQISRMRSTMRKLWYTLAGCLLLTLVASLLYFYYHTKYRTIRTVYFQHIAFLKRQCLKWSDERVKKTKYSAIEYPYFL
jgi:hypothetical protein